MKLDHCLQNLKWIKDLHMRCKPTRRTHSKHTLGHLDGQGLGVGSDLEAWKSKQNGTNEKVSN